MLFGNKAFFITGGIPRTHTSLPPNVCTSVQASLPSVQPLGGIYMKADCSALCAFAIAYGIHALRSA